MEIILVRHAKSEHNWNKWSTDSIRPLSEKGISRQHEVSKGMRKLNLEWDEVWVSPYRRAQETLDIILEYHDKSKSITNYNELIPSGDPGKVFKMLKKEFKTNPDNRILLVGHNPNMSELLGLISNRIDSPDLSTSDVAICEITIEGTRMIKYYSRNDLME